jgi:hypothetical protein
MAGLFAFISTPLGRVVAIGLALVIWTAYQRDQAADKAREECRAEQMEATIAEMERQRDAALTALREAEAQAARTRAEMQRLEEEQDAIIDDLADRGATACAIPDDILERLRNIR